MEGFGSELQAHSRAWRRESYVIHLCSENSKDGRHNWLAYGNLKEN